MAKKTTGLGRGLGALIPEAASAVGATRAGALEIPLALQKLAQSGEFDALVALGAVIRGETYHFEIVSDQSAAGLSRLGLDGVIIGNGILTTEDEAQAWTRARISEGDKGGGAARACLDLIALRKRLRVGLGA